MGILAKLFGSTLFKFIGIIVVLLIIAGGYIWAAIEMHSSSSWHFKYHDQVIKEQAAAQQAKLKQAQADLQKIKQQQAIANQQKQEAAAAKQDLKQTKSKVDYWKKEARNAQSKASGPSRSCAAVSPATGVQSAIAAALRYANGDHNQVPVYQTQHKGSKVPEGKQGGHR